MIISFDFPTDSYHRFKDKVKIALKAHKMKWISDHWENDTIRVDAIFMGHSKPATLIIKNATPDFIGDLKKVILAPRLLSAGGIPVTTMIEAKLCPKLHVCGNQLINYKGYDACTTCDFDTLEPEVKVKVYADETPQMIEAKKVEDVKKADENIVWLLTHVGNTLDQLRLFVSFNWYMMLPSEVEGWLNSYVDKGMIKREGNNYRLY